ncbi:uncharacterized protein isoform X2 [Leptinotarsa decemlineata]|uniref:uncharacterized protein isoform X2 n=1 Tax=Leptinotarsa decemlineata TaxID=7539 RepID=UPI003D30BA69
MPGYYCVFRGCSARTGEGTSIFRFPQDSERAKVWLEACSRQDLLPKVDSLHKNYRICEHHFESRYISKGTVKNTLLPEAVPTIFPPILKTENDQSQVPDRKMIILPDITIVPPSKCFFVKNANDEMPSFCLTVDDIKTECDETAGENEIVENKDDFWTFSETSALVEAYGHHIKSFAEDGHELPTWSRISTELSSKNIHRSPESCERKWESLVQKHNRGQTNYESDDVSNALVETAEQSSKRHKGDCECYERKIVAKQKRHRERMDLIKRKLEIEERKLAAFEKYLAHLSTGKE